MADRVAEMKAAFVAEMEAARAKEKAAEKKAAEKKAAGNKAGIAWLALPKDVRAERVKKPCEDLAACRAVVYAAEAVNKKRAAELIALTRQVDTAIGAMNTRDEVCNGQLTAAVKKRGR
jgi:hypothetical protein